jgi:hypothetical protein
MMIIGVDFDNTIVCYDRLFHHLAVEQSLIPAAVPGDKESVRNYLREQGREDDWTELQGLVYGTRIREAEPFPGVREFFLECRWRGIPVCVISHKTRLPVRGPQVDLHEAARGWLEHRRFHDAADIGLPADRVFFAETKQGKLQRIGELGCSHYIDDLPEFLLEPGFPSGVERVLFDPWDRHVGRVPFARVTSWDAARRRLVPRCSP